MSSRARAQKVDFWCGVRWEAPATLFLDFRAGDVGTPVEKMTALPSLHAFTPGERRTRPIMSGRSRAIIALGNEEFSAGLRASLEAAFEHEDMPIIRDVHRLMAGRDFWDLKPIVLTGDSGGVRARRVLARLIDEEQDGDRIAAE